MGKYEKGQISLGLKVAQEFFMLEKFQFKNLTNKKSSSFQHFKNLFFIQYVLQIGKLVKGIVGASSNVLWKNNPFLKHKYLL